MAAFLTDGNDTVYRVKEVIKTAVEKTGLHFSTQYCTPSPVLLVTLGRFQEQPHVKRLLSLLDSLNAQIRPTYLTDIRDIRIISTSKLDYRSDRGHLEIWPPVVLNTREQIQGPIKLLRPSGRLWYYRMMELLRRQ